jgi:DNA-binding transcriptional regulator YiaG
METTTRKPGRPPGKSSVTSDAVLRVREALGLTQQQLAAELNCSLSAVRRFERERVLPSSDALKKNFLQLTQRAGVRDRVEVEAE